ncbi:MAG: hypothetical protein KDD00_03335 [Ignavibacteriae bacterium]|nr:hypothetical protein [Ignavibacteriota bacterium]
MNYYKKDIQQISEISAYIALDKHKNTEHSMIEYKSSGFSPLKLYEAVLQTYLFCGFPATIESLRIFNKIFDKFKFPDHSQKYDFDYLMSEGETNCNLIYKNNYKKLIENMNKFSPDLKEWMILEGYGKVLGRKGLSLPEREIINVTILTARFYKHQLHSHIRGCMNIGVSSKEMSIIIESFNGFINKKNVSKCKLLFKSIIKSP